ncbi:MAG: ribosome-associated translation inhibitor RaiA [Anaerolineales bacterium]|nr:ribosome-associated translation inhibitor RaiA [Anaerolineales bacterium]
MPFEIEITGRNMEITDRLNDYVTKKVSKLDRYLNDIDEVHVELAHAKSARSASDRQVAQLTIRGKGFILRSEERADDIYAALDTALDKMQRRIERYKGKRNRGRGDGRSAADVVPYPESEEDEYEQPLIARRKHFVVSPMDEVEAIEQMNLLGHEDFFVFYNATTNTINVLYTRRDGTYGLIVPEIG